MYFGKSLDHSKVLSILDFSSHNWHVEALNTYQDQIFASNLHVQYVFDQWCLGPKNTPVHFYRDETLSLKSWGLLFSLSSTQLSYSFRFQKTAAIVYNRFEHDCEPALRQKWIDLVLSRTRKPWWSHHKSWAPELQFTHPRCIFTPNCSPTEPKALYIYAVPIQWLIWKQNEHS